MCTETNKTALLVHVMQIIVDVVVPNDKAHAAAAAIRVEEKYSIFAVLNQSDGVHILVSISIHDRARFYEHLKQVSGTLQLKYTELD